MQRDGEADGDAQCTDVGPPSTRRCRPGGVGTVFLWSCGAKPGVLSPCVAGAGSIGGRTASGRADPGMAPGDWGPSLLLEMGRGDAAIIRGDAALALAATLGERFVAQPLTGLSERAGGSASTAMRTGSSTRWPDSRSFCENWRTGSGGLWRSPAGELARTGDWTAIFDMKEANGSEPTELSLES